MKIVLGSIVGAFCIQLTFIACTWEASHGSGDAGVTGKVDAGVMGAVDAMVDALARLINSSTPDAKADSEAGAGGQPILGTLDVATETCTQSFSVTPDPSETDTYTYAEHLYPGFSAAQLSQVHVMGHLNPAYASEIPTVPGYTYIHPEATLGPTFPNVYVRDGAVAVICSSFSTPSSGNPPPWFDSVPFTLVE
jgi:hypothetical protein